MHNLGELNRLVKLLREQVEFVSDSKAKGLIGNILGEIKAAVSSEKNDRYELSAEGREIINEFKNDPVIQAYLNAKNGWQEKIRDLELEVNQLSPDSCRY